MTFRIERVAWLALTCAMGCADTAALPATVVVEDFEGDTSGWTLAGAASIETNGATSSEALHLNLAMDTCGVSSGVRTVTIPANAASIRLRMSGDIAQHNDNQLWFTLREDAVSVYGLAIPTLPVGTAREENWCIPTGGQGQTVTLSFVIRTQNACNAMDVWIDDIVFSSDATGCVEMEAPI